MNKDLVVVNKTLRIQVQPDTAVEEECLLGKCVEVGADEAAGEGGDVDVVDDDRAGC